MQALSKQTQRIRWKDGKERELAEFMKARTDAGMSITDALKAFAQENGISWLTARWKYYQMQRKKDSKTDQEVTKAVRRDRRKQDTATSEGQFLESLQRFIGASRASGVDVLPLVKGLARFATLAEEGAKLRARMEETEREKQALQAELERRRFESGEMEDHLKALLKQIDEWLGKSEVDRVQYLAEFASGLKREMEHIRRVIGTTA
ncbi:MAG: hypothetical protein IMW97_00280 [Firmicutes bacterium]|nr:hypothetical protein [Candidatus Fermentithermobacillaceae bacterium]